VPNVTRVTDRSMEAWSRRVHLAWGLVRERLSAADYATHVDELRRVLARRYLVVPFLELGNAFILATNPSTADLASAVSSTFDHKLSEFLPPAFRKVHEGGWLTGPGSVATLVDQLFELPAEERQEITAILEELTNAPLTLPATRLHPEVHAIEAQHVLTSRELAERAAMGLTDPVGSDSFPRSAALMALDRVLVVVVQERGRLRFDQVTPTLFKGLKLLPAFGCERLWLYASGGFDIDYARDLGSTREFEREGESFFDRVAFLGPFDVAMHLLS